MSRFNKFLAIIAAAVFSHWAQAESSIGGSIEDYHWQETIDNAPLSPEEYGLRYAIHLKWTQDRERGLLFGYRGKFYAGEVRYDTFLQTPAQTPVQTTTQYTGTVQEGQVIYRTGGVNHIFDYLAGLGLDTWQRNIDSNGYSQIKDFQIIYLRANINLDQPAHAIGWHGEGGLKYPIYTWEDAHLESLGYDSNPIITPGKDITLYAELGYRISKYWDVLGYYDSWRFKRSNIVVASPGIYECCVLQPKSSMDAYGITVIHSF